MPDANPSDEALIERANDGDDEAFEALYRRYRDWVTALAFRFTGNRDDALDVLQEVAALKGRHSRARGAAPGSPHRRRPRARFDNLTAALV